ncbi:MAG: rhodanese-like domain-containing protein [Gammaproteobacteria bacterium]|nr:rhodanese-like domain-containing protein [Gammaproteobacteria bacterium]
MAYLPEFILHHWELFASLLILLVLLFLYEWKAYQQQAKKISPQEAVLLMNQQALVLDMRAIAQFDKGHILNATHIDKDNYQPKPTNKSKKQTLIVVCQNGVASNTLASTWLQSGLTDIHVLAGGMDAWLDAGFPLTKTS